MVSRASRGFPLRCAQHFAARRPSPPGWRRRGSSCCGVEGLPAGTRSGARPTADRDAILAPMTPDRSLAGTLVVVGAACAIAYAGVLWWLWPLDLEREAQRQLAAEALPAAKTPPAASPERLSRSRNESAAPAAGAATTVVAPTIAVPEATWVAPAAAVTQSKPLLLAPAQAPAQGTYVPPRPPPGYTGPVDPFADDPYAPQPPPAAAR